MYHTLGKFDPSDIYVPIYGIKNTRKLYKKTIEEKLTQTTTLLRICQYIPNHKHYIDR